MITIIVNSMLSLTIPGYLNGDYMIDLKTNDGYITSSLKNRTKDGRLPSFVQLF